MIRSSRNPVPLFVVTDGIDRSQTVLVFITGNYLKKVAGVGPHGLSDNCYAEFSYALNRRGVERLIAVVLEPSCRDTKRWQGVVGLRLGSCLYIDLSMDAIANPREFGVGMEGLIKEIQKRLDESVKSGRKSSLANEMCGTGWDTELGGEVHKSAGSQAQAERTFGDGDVMVANAHV